MKIYRQMKAKHDSIQFDEIRFIGYTHKKKNGD